MNNNDLSRFSVVRLNAQLFPITPFEAETCDRYQITAIAVEATTPEEIVTRAAQCDALLVVSAALPDEVIGRLERCRVISRIGTGTDKIDVDAATRDGILVTNVPDFCVHEQAEHTMAMLLALVRKLTQMRSAMQAGQWTGSRTQCRSIHRLTGRVLGLVGFGGSAKEVARRAVGFGLRVLATRKRMQRADQEAQRLGVEMVDLDRLLAESDYVSLHLPLDQTTHRLMDAARLAKMKPGAFLINTSRGALVDEAALLAALREGRLAGAGLDTFEQINVHGQDESPPNHPLLELDNVVFTPHVAAFSEEAGRDVGTGGVDNLAAVLSGRWPPRQRIVNPLVDPRFSLE